MKALLARDYGPPDTFRIERLPIPEPGPGQVQVRVRAASLNPADLLMAAGTVREMVPLNFPYVPGTDFAGTVTKLGPDVDGFAEGEEVFGFGAPPSFAAGVGIAAVTTGAMAEYARLPGRRPVRRRTAGRTQRRTGGGAAKHGHEATPKPCESWFVSCRPFSSDARTSPGRRRFRQCR